MNQPQKHPHGFRLRWRRDPKPRGLAGPRGHTLYDANGTRFATVNYSRNASGWYWVAGWESGIAYKNAAFEALASVEDAKAAAMEYVRGALR